jgi:hypothetical protein
MEESTRRAQRFNPRLKVRPSGEAYKRLRGRILGFRRNEAHGPKQHLHPGGVMSLPMPRNEEAHLAVSLVQPLRGHRVLQVGLTSLP